jgi:hypothetical protein
LEWANIAKPFTWFILGLIAAVMLLPFAFNPMTKEMMDWAKTILPPAIGFGGAIIGYYFGTSASGGSSGSG